MEQTYIWTPFETAALSELVRIREALERLSPVPEPEPEDDTEPAEDDPPADSEQE